MHLSIGTSIFLSVVLLSVVLLFISTKDRWNWKKIILFAVGGSLIIGLLLGGGYWAYMTISTRPHLQSSFLGTPISASKSEVKFLNGEPLRKTGNEEWETWEYVGNKGTYARFVYNIVFKQDKIYCIVLLGGDSFHPYGTGYWDNYIRVQGFGYDNSHKSIIQKFGQPSHISMSKDDLARVLSFKKYGVFFVLNKNKISDYGIYNPTLGPIEFGEAKEEVK
jgi:hypothetical protein